MITSLAKWCNKVFAEKKTEEEKPLDGEIFSRKKCLLLQSLSSNSRSILGALSNSSKEEKEEESTSQ